MKFTKLEAIKEMQDLGSHGIFLEQHTEVVNAICKPFGCKPPWRTYTVDDAPWGKGPQPMPDRGIGWGDKFEGVSGFEVAQRINLACDGTPSHSLGRGTGYREDLNNAREALEKLDTAKFLEPLE